MSDIVLTPVPTTAVVNLTAAGGGTVAFNTQAPASTADLMVQAGTGETLLSPLTSGDILSFDGPDEYGLPYYTASDGDYIYYSWRHISGTGWLAQRVEFDGLGRSEITGAGIQPDILSDFEALGFA